MIEQKRLEELRNKIESSPFNKKYYEINLSLYNFQSNVMYWGLPLNVENKKNINNFNEFSTKDVLKTMVPEFQRGNDKWTKEMQISFVENIILGVSSTITLAYTTDGDKSRIGIKRDCIILDGLQRFTALSAWIDGEFPIFDDIYYSKELIEKIEFAIYGLKLRIYMFENKKEMIEFYIKINENITHSPDDIKKAKKILKKEEQILNKKTTNIKKGN